MEHVLDVGTGLCACGAKGPGQLRDSAGGSSGADCRRRRHAGSVNGATTRGRATASQSDTRIRIERVALAAAKTSSSRAAKSSPTTSVAAKSGDAHAGSSP